MSDAGAAVDLLPLEVTGRTVPLGQYLKLVREVERHRAYVRVVAFLLEKEAVDDSQGVIVYPDELLPIVCDGD